MKKSSTSKKPKKQKAKVNAKPAPEPSRFQPGEPRPGGMIFIGGVRPTKSKSQDKMKD